MNPVSPGSVLIRGSRCGRWSVWVTGNWRLMFAFQGFVLKHDFSGAEIRSRMASSAPPNKLLHR